MLDSDHTWVHAEVAEAQPGAVVPMVLAEEPPRLPKDQGQDGGGQGEVGKLPEVVVTEEAHVPVVRLNVARYGHYQDSK